VADRDSAELRALPAANLEEHCLAVVLHVLQLEGTELAESHSGSKRDLNRQGRPASGVCTEERLQLRRRVGLSLLDGDFGGADAKKRGRRRSPHGMPSWPGP